MEICILGGKYIIHVKPATHSICMVNKEHNHYAVIPPSSRKTIYHCTLGKWRPSFEWDGDYFGNHMFDYILSCARSLFLSDLSLLLLLCCVRPPLSFHHHPKFMRKKNILLGKESTLSMAFSLAPYAIKRMHLMHWHSYNIIILQY